MTTSAQRHARTAGVCYLVTFAASIPAAYYFLTPLLDDPAYVLGPGSDTRVVVGCLLDVVNAIACVGTAVALFPVLRHDHESLALGFVASRLFEAAVIAVGVVSLLAVVTLRDDGPSPGVADAELVASQHALVAVRDATFQLGPNLCAAVNALLLGTLLLRSRRVPPVIPAIGLVGAPFLLAAAVATVLGLVEQGSAWFAGALLVAAWELSLGIYLTTRGLRLVAA